MICTKARNAFISVFLALICFFDCGCTLESKTNYTNLVDYLSLQELPTDFENSSIFIFDDKGIIKVDYADWGEQYNPVTICQYALSLYKDWIDNHNALSINKFIKQAEYLLKNYVEISPGMISWAYDFDFPSYNLKAPWYSAMANGQVVSVLLRYCLVTSEPDAIDICQKALRYMVQQSQQDSSGLATITPEGTIWFEEYPSNPPSLVLNGFIFSTIGLLEYCKLYPLDRYMNQKANEAIKSLKLCLPKYDTGSWTYYDRYSPQKLATELYMKIHITQMFHLYELTKDDFFYSYYALWKEYVAG